MHIMVCPGSDVRLNLSAATRWVRSARDKHISKPGSVRDGDRGNVGELVGGIEGCDVDVGDGAKAA